MKHSLPLNFVASSRISYLHFHWLGCCIGLLGTLVLLYVFNRYQMVLADYQQLEAVTASRIQHKAKTISPVQVKPSLPTAQRQEILRMLEDFSTPWERLFVALEQANLPDIALLSITPDKTKHRITLIGQAKNYDSMLKYLQQLQSASGLQQVLLQQHAVDETHPFKPVNFTVVGQWS